MPPRLNTEEFIKKACAVHGDKYDYSQVNYIKNNIKINIICPVEGHGLFKQLPKYHIITKLGCSKCSGNYKYDTNEFIKRAQLVHKNKYDYSETNYINDRTKIKIICKTHGAFEQRASYHLNKSGCNVCNTYTTESWIKKANSIHKNKYDYSQVQYVNAKTKIKIICKNKHKYMQFPSKHLHGDGCSKCLLCAGCGLWRTYDNLCDYCEPNSIANQRIYQKSKEFAVVNYLKEQLPKHEFIHNRSVGTACTLNDRENTNGHLYPDIRFDCGFFHLIVEIDEFEHRGADYSCDKRRMHDIIAKLGLPCIFLRYNPDSQESDKYFLLQFVKKYLKLKLPLKSPPWDTHGFKAIYLFYTK